MAETLTVTVDDDASYSVNVGGVDLFSDADLTTPVTFPTTIATDTTWYAAPHSGRRAIGVTITRVSDGDVMVSQSGIGSLPFTFNATEGGQGSATGPAGSGGSSQVAESWLYTQDDAALNGSDLGTVRHPTFGASTANAGDDLALSVDNQKIVVGTRGLYAVTFDVGVSVSADPTGRVEIQPSASSIGYFANGFDTFSFVPGSSGVVNNVINCPPCWFEAGDEITPWLQYHPVDTETCALMHCAMYVVRLA